MLPIFMTENPSYTVEGVMHCAAVFHRSFVVVDGEALIGQLGKDVPWDKELPRRQLMSELITAIGRVGPRGNLTNKDVEAMAVMPIVMSANEAGPGAWRALLVKLPIFDGILQVGRGGDVRQAHGERCQRYVQKWQQATGTECGVLTGNKQFAQVEQFLLDAIRETEKYSNTSQFFQKTGEVLCPPKLISPAFHGVLHEIMPALSNSLLHETTPRAASPGKGPRL